MTCREALLLKTKSLLNKIFLYNFYYIYFSIPRKNICLWLAALYLNTAESFKSSMTKIYCWPPVLDPVYWKKKYLYCGSPHNINVSHLLQCQEKLILLPVRDNLSSQGTFSISPGKLDSFKEIRGRSTYFCIFTEVKHIPIARYCFHKLNDKQI